MREGELTEAIIGAAIDVHRELGPGLLESAYASCLAFEFACREIVFEREKRIPVVYRGHPVDCGFVADFLVDGRVVVELKAVDKLHPVHEAQILTYLKLTRAPVGLLFNFNARVLKEGLRRYDNRLSP